MIYDIWHGKQRWQNSTGTARSIEHFIKQRTGFWLHTRWVLLLLQFMNLKLLASKVSKAQNVTVCITAKMQDNFHRQSTRSILVSKRSAAWKALNCAMIYKFSRCYVCYQKHRTTFTGKTHFKSTMKPIVSNLLSTVCTITILCNDLYNIQLLLLCWL